MKTRLLILFVLATSLFATQTIRVGHQVYNFQDLDTTSSPTFDDLTLTGDLTVTGTGQFDRIGVGIAPSSTVGIYGNCENSTGQTNGIVSSARYTGEDDAVPRGIYLYTLWQPTSQTASDTLSFMYGSDGKLLIQSPASTAYDLTVTEACGFRCGISANRGSGSSGAVSITNVYDFHAISGPCLNGATIDTHTGFYCPSLTNATTNWGFGINTQSYVNAALSVGKNTAPATTLDVAGSTTLGAASTDTITCTGRWIPRTVGADPTSNATAGSLGEIVFYNDKWYGKTVSDGTDTNWAALN